MALNPMPVGARVTIRPSSRYYGRNPDRNPANEVGVVEGNDCHGMPYRVRWLHSGIRNGYNREDLKYWRGRAPKRKPEPAVDPADLQGLIDKAISDCKKESQNVTARYAFIYNNGKIVVSQNTACHHSVMSLGRDDKLKTQSIVTCINGPKAQDAHLTKEESVQFYDWLLNRSPYANAFVSKDADESFNKHKYAVMNVSAPANMLQGALITTRQPWEHHNVVKVFCKLVDRGVDENTAYILGSLFRESTGDSLTYGMQMAGHFNLDLAVMKVADCISFVRNTPYKLTKPFNEGGEPMAVHDMFIGKGKDSARNYAKKLVGLAGAKKGTLQTNPFAAAKRVETESVSYDDLASYVKTNGVFA